MKIKMAGHKEITSISKVIAASWKSAYRGIVDDQYLDMLAPDHWVDFLSEGLHHGNIFAMVLEDNQQIIGAAILSCEEKKAAAHLISFYILPGQTGRGYGHTFYSGIEAELHRRGISKCILDVLTDNTRAIHFYESCGFTNTGRTVTADLGDCTYSCKVYEKNLY